MKKLILLITVITFYSSAFAQQNLIPNPSFEEYNKIPVNKGGIKQNKCKDWFTGDNTPDYFHMAAPLGSEAAVPNNAWGSIIPHSDSAYAGFINWCNRECREYISVELINQLEIGKEYEFSAYIASANNWVFSNAQGVLFSVTHPENLYASNNNLGYENHWIIAEPSYYRPNILNNSGNWKLMTFKFTATKSHRYLTIGNFFVIGDNRETVFVNDPQNGLSIAYIDDVSLVETGRKTAIEYTILNTCEGSSVLVEFRGVNVDTTTDWEWRFGDGTIYNDTVITKEFEISGINTFQVVTSESGESFTFYESIDINVLPPPLASFTIEEETVFDSPLSFINKSKNATAYFWDFGDGEISTESNPIHTYENIGEYTIRLIAENELTCRDTTYFNIFAKCGKRITENVFTPNNDGINDAFYFDSTIICDVISIQIFNQWGNLVYESTNPNEPWNGEGYPSGTYYFVVRFRDGIDKGFITLIR